MESVKLVEMNLFAKQSRVTDREKNTVAKRGRKGGMGDWWDELGD